MWPHDYSTHSAIRIESWLGNWTSSGSFKSSMYVQSVLLGIRWLSTPLQTELAMDTHKVVTNIDRNVSAGLEGHPSQHQSVSGFPSTNDNMLTIL